MNGSKGIQISRRFQRAIRIDTAFSDPEGLQGFICPKSSQNVLISTAYHVSQTRHGAFTWTGPYGSGKSSLIVALSALLGNDASLREQARCAIGEITAQCLLNELPPKSQGWRILPVVGRRENPARVIGEAIRGSEKERYGKVRKWSDSKVVSCLSEMSSRRPRQEGGLILFVDEMGKFLEAAAHGRADVYLFQLLAEAASRSNGRFILIGVLHQSFAEYANHLSRELRDEWTKIQGRFVDLAVNVSGEEQIELISRAIQVERASVKPNATALIVADQISRQRPLSSANLSTILARCWPLHPVVACLLAPISCRRYGQNQRSIFGFLNSAEPFGFQDFLRDAVDENIYELDRLWDYLRVNLEPAILASSDGHKWAMAVEALDRCEALGGNSIHIQLLKTVALIEMFKERSGLVPNITILQCCVTASSKTQTKKALDQLQKWSLIIFRKFTDSYSVYAGSDFDIDRALDEALEKVREVNFDSLEHLAGLQPILAKRHYHETGAFRWFDVHIVPLNSLAQKALSFQPRDGVIGLFLLAIPTKGESERQAQEICRDVAASSLEAKVVPGVSKRARPIMDLARELQAIDTVREDHPNLAGDLVAQREIEARNAILQGQLEQELRQALNRAVWYKNNGRRAYWSYAQLSSAASEIAENRYSKSPHIHNELLNRIKPSASAVGAQNSLLRHMVTCDGEERLGIKGFPAEGGLFASLLEETGLYSKRGSKWCFVPPKRSHDPCKLLPLWKAATEKLISSKDNIVAVNDLYELWSKPPFGLQHGLLPVLSVAFILSKRDQISIYRQGVFQPKFKDIDVEVLVVDPSEVQLRWMDLSDVQRRLLSSMAEVVRTLDTKNPLTHLTTIDVARGLISVYEHLPAWTKRTTRLSAKALHVRNLFKRAVDPNKFLFDDIPALLGTDTSASSEDAFAAIVNDVQDGLTELVNAYPSMLGRISEQMLEELQVPNTSAQAFQELQERAENILELDGDFRLEAFIGRLSQFNGSIADIEGIASLATDKPPRDWTDPDLNKAAVEISVLAQQFIRNESFARVKGRRDKRQALSVVVGLNGRPKPVHREFSVTDIERPRVDALKDRLSAAVSNDCSVESNVILAALAELSAHYMSSDAPVDSGSDTILEERRIS